MKHFALGRLKTGAMNKTEEAYGRLLRDRQLAGEVVWYAFEAVNLRLADNTFYKPDFLVQLASGEVQVHEVKGGRAIFTEDARVKVKVAADKFPFQFIVAYPRSERDGGGWDIEEF